MKIHFTIRRRTAPTWLLALVLALPGLLQSTASLAEAQSGSYLLGVFPHLPPRDLEKVFAPMAADLGQTIGTPVQLRTSTTYEKFSAQLDNETFDIAFIQPFDYIRAADKGGYRPLATRTEKLSAIVVTGTDSPLNSIQDLRNKRVALPPKTAAVSQLLRAHLKSIGINPDKDIQLTHHRSHVSCMQQVLIGEAVACGTAAPARRFFQSKFSISMKVIGKSRDIPHTLWAIHQRVPAKDRERIRKRIIDWSNTREGQQLLDRGKLTPFIPIKDADYNIVRRLAR